MQFENFLSIFYTFMETLTITLSGKSSVLDAQFFPPIELTPNKNYSLGLIEFLTFNSIPNITRENNLIVVGTQRIFLPTGSYEIEDIEKYLKEKLAGYNINFSLKPNNNTLQSEIKCSEPIDLTQINSIGRLLGFNQQIYPANIKHLSERPVSILKVNSVRIDCNITTGAYLNDKKSHTIHEFFPSVPPGYKIIEIPSQVIYLPLTVNSIDHIQLRITDQDGDLIDFRGEVITIRLHIKS